MPENRPLVILSVGLWDTGKHTLMRLGPYLESVADVELFDSGWTWLTTIRWKNKERAKKLAEHIAGRPCVVISHSNGCAVARDCSLLDPPPPIRAMIWLNPALDRVVQVGPQVGAIEVFHTHTDVAVGVFARMFGFGHPFGPAGADGMDLEKMRDARFTNRNMPGVFGHLGIFSKLDTYGPEIRDLVRALWMLTEDDSKK